MSVSPPAERDPRLTRICEIVSGLCQGREGAAPVSGEGDELDRVLAGVEALAAEIEVSRGATERTQRRLEELTDVCLALVAFDYQKKAPISDANDLCDGMAAALNMLGEELDASTVSITYMRDVFESMSDALVIAGEAGDITLVNDAACALAALPREELVGKSLEIVFPGVSVADVVKRGGVHDQEVSREGALGKQIPLSFSASVLRNDKGGTTELICVARDLTESKKADEEQWRLREAVQRQSILLEELSIPLIPITKEVLVVPLVGSLDEGRADRLSTGLLTGIASRGARTVILDITGMRAVDSAAVEGIVRAVQAAKLLGSEVLLTGVRADVARMLVELGVEIGIPTFSALQHGIAHGLRRRGFTSTRA